MRKLTIIRTKNYVGCLNNIEVKCNGQIVTKIGNGVEETFEIDNSKFTLEFKMFSGKNNITIEQGEEDITLVINLIPGMVKGIKDIEITKVCNASPFINVNNNTNVEQIVDNKTKDTRNSMLLGVAVSFLVVAVFIPMFLPIF